jgi:hypothetical protein
VETVGLLLNRFGRNTAMRTSRRIERVLCATLVAAVAVLARVSSAGAHCDGLDGPVVTAARRALELEDAAPILIWVQARDEAAVREAFQRTLAVRRFGPQARKLADMYFFETVVRMHRAGEGASYDGLKPAGRDLGPAIPAADRALETGSPDDLIALLTDEIRRSMRTNFDVARKRKAFDAHDIAAGREYVEAYVQFIHFVERIFQATRTPAHGHFAEPGIQPAHED